MRQRLFFASLLVGIFVCIFSCTDDKNGQAASDGIDTSEVQEMQLSLNSSVDKLTPLEQKYFKKFQYTGDFFISDSVVRYHRFENGKIVNFYNEFLYQRDVADLIGGVYISYSMSYTPIESEDSDPFINYSFRAGNATSGHGSIIKLGDKIIHTERGCGTSCATVVRQNGKKIVEKVE